MLTFSEWQYGTLIVCNTILLEYTCLKYTQVLQENLRPQKSDEKKVLKVRLI